MIRRLLLLVLLVLAPIQATAQQSLAGRFLEGSWALRVEGSIIMRWDLERQGETWGGTWVKPTSFRSDGVRFGNIVMPSTERTADRGQAIGEWAEITFDDPRPGEEPDQFRFRLIGPDRAEMLYVGTGLPPFILERVAADALIGPFEEGEVYGSAAAPGPARPAATPSTAVPPAPRATPPATPRQQAPLPAEQPPVQGPPAMTGR